MITQVLDKIFRGKLEYFGLSNFFFAALKRLVLGSGQKLLNQIEPKGNQSYQLIKRKTEIYDVTNRHLHSKDYFRVIIKCFRGEPSKQQNESSMLICQKLPYQPAKPVNENCPKFPN